MTAKEYLGQAYRIDQRINNKLEQICLLRALATKATSTLSHIPISGARNLHSMSDSIVKMVDLENEINTDIDALVDIKCKIVALIKSVHDLDQQILLELRYLCFCTWDEIATKMGLSVRSIFRIHDAVLKKILFS